MCHTTKAVGFQEPYTRVGLDNTRMDLGAALQRDESRHPKVYDPIKHESRPSRRCLAGTPRLSCSHRRRWRRHPLALPHTLKLCPPEVRAFRVMLPQLYHDWPGRCAAIAAHRGGRSHSSHP